MQLSPAGSHLCSLKQANLCGSVWGVPGCLHKGWWEHARRLLRQKELMLLQNLFILNVYQITNPACQLCHFSYKFCFRRLFLFFFINSFLRDAAVQDGLFHLLVDFQALCCGVFPSPFAGPSPQVCRSNLSLGIDSDNSSASHNPHFSRCSAERSRAQSLSRFSLQDYSFLKLLSFLV